MRIQILCLTVILALSACRSGFEASEANPDAPGGPIVDAAPGTTADAAPGTMADAGSTGSPDAGPTPPGLGPCGSAGVHRDEFLGVSPRPFWDLYGTTIQNGGTLTSALEPTGMNEFTAAFSSRTVSLRDARTTIEIADIADPDSDATAMFSLDFDQINHMGFYQFQGILYVESVVNGFSDNDFVAFDPIAHQIWQIREEGGTIFMEASSDGMSWDTLLTTPTPPFVDAVTVALGMFLDEFATTGGRVDFERFNHLASPAEWCPAATLRDNFNDNDIDLEKWSRTQGFDFSCTATETNGAAQVVQPMGTNGICFFASATNYDLTDSGVAIQVEIASLQEPWFIPFLAVGDYNNTLITLNGFMGQLCATVTVDYITPEPGYPICIDHDFNLRYWRIREQDGLVYWEVSDDPIDNWRTIHSAVPPIDVTAVQASFGAASPQFAPVQMERTFRVLDFNTL